MLISQIISKPLVYSEVHESLKSATYKMLKFWKRRLPITKRGKLFAIITSMDLINAFYLNIDFELTIIDSKIYSEPVYFVYEDEKFDNIIETLIKLKIGGLVIVDKNHKPIGVFTEKDALKFLEIKDLTAKDIMTHKPISLKETNITSPITILNTIVKTKFRNIPVVKENNEVSGIINSEFLLTFIALSNFDKNMFNSFSRESLIVRSYPCVKENTKVRDIVKIFISNEKCDAVMIVNEENKLVGIITERDILQKCL